MSSPVQYIIKRGLPTDLTIINANPPKSSLSQEPQRVGTYELVTECLPVWTPPQYKW